MSDTDEVVQVPVTEDATAAVPEPDTAPDAVPEPDAAPAQAEKPAPKSLVSLKPRIAIIAGIVCIVGWIGLLAGLFAGVEAFSSGQVPAFVIFAFATVAAASTLFVRNAWTVIAFVAAILYGVVVVYFRNGFDTTMPDAVFYVLVGIFYLMPPIAGLSAVLAGTSASRSTRN